MANPAVRPSTDASLCASSRTSFLLSCPPRLEHLARRGLLSFKPPDRAHLLSLKLHGVAAHALDVETQLLRRVVRPSLVGTQELARLLRLRLRGHKLRLPILRHLAHIRAHLLARAVHALDELIAQLRARAVHALDELLAQLIARTVHALDELLAHVLHHLNALRQLRHLLCRTLHRGRHGRKRASLDGGFQPGHIARDRELARRGGLDLLLETADSFCEHLRRELVRIGNLLLGRVDDGVKRLHLLAARHHLVTYHRKLIVHHLGQGTDGVAKPSDLGGKVVEGTLRLIFEQELLARCALELLDRVLKLLKFGDLALPLHPRVRGLMNGRSVAGLARAPRHRHQAKSGCSDYLFFADCE